MARRSSFFSSFAVYGDRRMLAILLMGFSSGLPLLLGFSTLSYWLSAEGVDRTTIGLFAAVASPYAFKFAWAPLIDQLRLPVFQRLFGRRRGWMLFLQILLAGAILWLGTSDPLADPAGMAAAAVLVAFLSASQDIVVDAYRIEVLQPDEQGAGSAATQFGYRIGMIAAGAGALALSDLLPWAVVYAVMAALVAVGMVGALIGPEPRSGQELTEATGTGTRQGTGAGLVRWLKRAVVDPFADFLTRPGWLLILFFVLLYKYGDAVAGAMANPFYQELGFTGLEIGSVTKVFGVVATLLGVFVGGALCARFGIVRALVIGGLLQAVTNLLYAWLAYSGKDVGLLAVVVGADNFTGGLGSAAFVAYLSSLCNVAFTGTQYALLSSFMAFGRTLLSTGSGWLVDQIGWAPFFVATTLLAVPGLVLLYWIVRLDPAGAARRGGRSYSVPKAS